MHFGRELRVKFAFNAAQESLEAPPSSEEPFHALGVEMNFLGQRSYTWNSNESNDGLMPSYRRFCQTLGMGLLYDIVCMGHRNSPWVPMDRWGIGSISEPRI